MNSKQILRVFGLWVILSSQSLLAANKEAGKIAMIKGDVLILNEKKQIVADPEGKRGRKTAVDAPFFEGETIQTKAEARVKLVFVEGGNEVVLGADTSLVIARAGSQSPGTELSLNKGTVRSQVLRKYSGEGSDVFEVKTPNSVAGVRGTVFQVNFDMNTAKTVVFTESGVVAVRSLAQQAAPQLVKANSFSEVSKSGAPSQAKPMDAASKQNMILLNSEGDAKEGSKQESPKEGPANANTGAASAGTGSNAQPSGAAPAEGAAPQAEVKVSKKSEAAPNVAMAPAPTDSLSKGEARGPASVGDMPAGSAAPMAAKMMLPSNTANNSASNMMSQINRNPMDMVNNQSEAMRRQMEDTLRQQRSVEGNFTETTLSIK